MPTHENEPRVSKSRVGIAHQSRSFNQSPDGGQCPPYENEPRLKKLGGHRHKSRRLRTRKLCTCPLWIKSVMPIPGAIGRDP